MEIERRTFTGEIRAEKRGEDTQIVGYAAVFGHESEDLGGFREVIEPGAFDEALGRDDVRALFNHDANLILGRTPKTLRLRVDENGLHYDIDPPDTQAARDLMVSLGRGDVDQSSFGFSVVSETWEQPTDERNYPLRRINKVRLFDVSPVTFPAYTTTSAEARAMASELSRQVTALDNKPVGRLDILKRRLRLKDAEV